MSRISRLRIEQLEDRLTPNTAGTLDPSFGTGGIVSFGNSLDTRVSPLPDGRFYALNSSTLGRFLPDGSPDATFGGSGVVQVPGSVSQFSSVVTALPDGGALVGGVTGMLFPLTEQFAVARITASGAIDPTFGSGGTAVFGPTGLEYRLNSLVVQPDGRVLVVGGQTNGSTGEMVVDRLTAAGQLDPTFGNSGTVIVSFPAGASSAATATDADIQPDGRIILSGRAAATPAAVRLTSHGQLDPTFGSGGITLVPFPQDTGGVFQTVSILSDGRVLVAGNASTGTGLHGAAARLTPAGQLDPTFGTGGLGITNSFPITTSSVYEMNAAIDSSGRVVFAAVPHLRGNIWGDNLAIRLSAGGSADTGFGTGGQVNVSSLPGVPADRYLIKGLATLPNGDILLGGSGVLVRLIGSNPPAGFVPAAPGTILAGGAADGTVQVLAPSNGGYAVGSLSVYPGFPGNVRATTADVNGDGTLDYVFAAGPGGFPAVTVFDGKAGTVLADFLAFESSFSGGVFVAAADLDGDGKAEILATPDLGGGARVVAFSVAGGAAIPRGSFFGIDDPNFRGGARLALGDVNNDGTPDLLVAAGFGGGPRVTLIDGKTVFGSRTVVANFFAFPEDAQTLRNGVFAALGDVNGDGFADMTFGGGPGGGPRVLILSGNTLITDSSHFQAQPVANFFVANNSADRGGVRLAVKDADGDAKADVVAGSGEGSQAKVRVYLGNNFTSTVEPATFQDVGVFGGGVLPGGVFVG